MRAFWQNVKRQILRKISEPLVPPKPKELHSLFELTMTVFAAAPKIDFTACAPALSPSGVEVSGGEVHVLSVAAYTETDSFRIDFRAVLFSVLILFQHDNACAVAQHEAVAIFI